MIISIHALLAESDVEEVSGDTWARDFYPRSPCGERLPLFGALCGLIIFLSTLSLRRATLRLPTWAATVRYFYPRSPCGERLVRELRVTSNTHFYPRSPCGERQPAENHASTQQEFLSTLSLRRATLNR